MIHNKNIICISSIDWDFIWQGHQEIMSTLAKNGNRVLFIENTGVRSPSIRDIPRLMRRIKNYFKGTKGFRREMENLYILSPLLLPFPYFRIARWINQRLILSVLRRWMVVMDFGDPIIWTFLPTPLSLDIINNLAKKLTVYYCIDNFRVSSISARKIARPEIDLLKSADLVFVTSSELYNYSSTHNNRVHMFPFAVNYEKFEQIRLSQNPIPEELQNIKKPIVGYVGGIHKWIDQKLLGEVAQQYSDFSFVFVGPIQTDISLLSKLKNVYFLGKKEHEKVPLFIKNFDICIVPYSITDYTKNVYPTKLNEYLAMGKSVVSTSLPEVITFNKKHGNLVYVAENTEDFGNCISSSLKEDSQNLRDMRIEVAKENSWSNAIENMSGLIEGEIARKESDIEVHWKEKLVNFYKKAQRKIIVFGVVCLAVYMMLFKTSFVWFLAEPLKISQAPEKTEAIVVFGGGVGETGNPGKSTIERARYAAKLYNEGFGEKIIFSSGYTYKYNDAENMRLIALSEGVKNEDIILEQHANSAYENVRFSKGILDENEWDSILLVSSPYNMRRVSLVFSKWGKEIEVIYAPVKTCQFYDKSAGLNLEQLRAIMHEYLGIIYYWWKGRI